MTFRQEMTRVDRHAFQVLSAVSSKLLHNQNTHTHTHKHIWTIAVIFDGRTEYYYCYFFIIENQNRVLSRLVKKTWSKICVYVSRLLSLTPSLSLRMVGYRSGNPSRNLQNQKGNTPASLHCAPLPFTMNDRASKYASELFPWTIFALKVM